MSGDDTQPDVIGEVEVGAQNDLPSMTDVAGDDQPLQRDMERAQGRQRGDDGKFAKRETVKNPNAQGLTREEVTRQYKKAIADETDTEALDGVKPTRQDPAAKTDQRQPKKGTLDTGKDGPADTTQSAELKKAREHLKLDRWTDAKLSKLTDAQILDFGKEAQEEHARKYAEGREQAAAKNGKGQPPRPESADGDDEETAEFETLAKEHFKEFEGDESAASFSKSLAGFAKATHARTRAVIEREVGAIATEAREMLAKIQTNLESQMRFEIGLRDLATDYPKAATPEGREELASRVNALTKDNAKRDVVQTMREQAKGLWGGDARPANAEREAKLRAARSGGHADLSSMGEAPRKRSDWEVGLEAVRKHITSAG